MISIDATGLVTAYPEARSWLQESRNLVLWRNVVEASGVVTYHGAPGFYQLVAWSPTGKAVLLGDSTASDVNGWGKEAHAYLNFTNLAVAWATTRSFLAGPRPNADMLLVNFGFVDSVVTSPEEYGANLRTIAGLAPKVVFLSPLPPRGWVNGRFIPYLRDRTAVMRTVALETGAEFVDLNAKAAELYDLLGSDACAYMDFVPGDKVHFSDSGGETVARLVLDILPGSMSQFVIKLP